MSLTSAKECSCHFYAFFFESIKEIWTEVDFTKIIVSVIPQQSVRLNITKKSFGDASIKFQPMFEDHCKSARIESYRYSLPSVKANTAERIVKTANSFIS